MFIYIATKQYFPKPLAHSEELEEICSWKGRPHAGENNETPAMILCPEQTRPVFVDALVNLRTVTGVFAYHEVKSDP